MPYLEKYLQTKLGTPIRDREFRLGNVVIQGKAFGVGHAAIQSYPECDIAIRSSLFRISTLSGARLRIKSYSGWNSSDIPGNSSPPLSVFSKLNTSSLLLLSIYLVGRLTFLMDLVGRLTFLMDLGIVV